MTTGGVCRLLHLVVDWNHRGSASLQEPVCAEISYDAMLYRRTSAYTCYSSCSALANAFMNFSERHPTGVLMLGAAFEFEFKPWQLYHKYCMLQYFTAQPSSSKLNNVIPQKKSLLRKTAKSCLCSPLSTLK